MSDAAAELGVNSSILMLIRCPAGASNSQGFVCEPQCSPVPDWVDGESSVLGRVMCCGLDITDTAHERSSSTTDKQNSEVIAGRWKKICPIKGYCRSNNFSSSLQANWEHVTNDVHTCDRPTSVCHKTIAAVLLTWELYTHKKQARRPKSTMLPDSSASLIG